MKALLLIACVGIGLIALYSKSTRLSGSQSRVSSWRELQLDAYKFEENQIYLDKNDFGSDHQFKDYRVLAFGTSRTWGSGLRNRSLAYPYLLNPNATNLAIRASGPEVPAMCTYSLVGDEIYDVIVFEYFMQADNKLITLVRRLRQRFPKSTFVFLKIISPFQFLVPGEAPTGKSLMDLMREAEVEKNLPDCAPLGCSVEEFHMIVDSQERWVYKNSLQAERIIDQLVIETNGICVTQKFELGKEKEHLHAFAPMFLGDGLHFSAYGACTLEDSAENEIPLVPNNEINYRTSLGSGCHFELPSISQHHAT